jgi:hypothetical protein
MTEPQHDRSLLLEISKKLNVLIAFSLRRPEGERIFLRTAKGWGDCAQSRKYGIRREKYCGHCWGTAYKCQNAFDASQKGKSKNRNSRCAQSFSAGSFSRLQRSPAPPSLNSFRAQHGRPALSMNLALAGLASGQARALAA